MFGQGRAMKAGFWLGLIGSVALGAKPVVLLPQDAGKPTESAHKKGPNGLEGWTLDSPNPGTGERIPFTLVIARSGRAIRRIEGDPTIWKWMFRADGQQIAIMTGPLHFSATCFLQDLATGKKLASYDCYHDMPLPEPDWVKDLESTE
jgi:hypothetical protein